MTMARQMYPSNPPYFMRHFEEAKSHLYGYLLVDLKPQTLAPDEPSKDVRLPGSERNEGKRG